jgi:hypothetical protein
MNRLQILSAAKAVLATGSGQPDKHLAICFAITAVVGHKRSLAHTAREIRDEIMAHLAPHLTFRSKLFSGEHSIETVQAARHAYLDKLIQEAAK